MPEDKGKTAQPFGEHIRELRQRIFYVVIALVGGAMVGYFIHERLFHILRRPLHAQLYYTTPTGGFNAIIKISIMFGVLVAIPVFIYQLCKFLSPAFNHRFKIYRIVVASCLFAVLGVIFAYYMSLPAALHFLSNVDPGNLQPLITINEYLGFMFAYMTAFAILFQLPLVMLFINRIKPQRPGRLMRIQRWIIVVSFALAAVLTPTPDPVNQTIMALPIILLYQLSVILIWFVNQHPKNKARLAEQELQSDEPDDLPDTPVKPDNPNPFSPPIPSLTSYKATDFGSGRSFPSPMPLATSNASPDSQFVVDIFKAA